MLSFSSHRKDQQTVLTHQAQMGHKLARRFAFAAAAFAGQMPFDVAYDGGLNWFQLVGLAQRNTAGTSRAPLSLRDLPNMMVQFGRQRQSQATGLAKRLSPMRNDGHFNAVRQEQAALPKRLPPRISR